MNILFAGGGTGGHLFPALALAEEIKQLRPDASITFLGTPDHLEARVVPERGFPFQGVPSVGLRKTPQGIVRFVWTIVRAVRVARALLKQDTPDLVVGTGGYVSAPALLAAQSLGIPTAIQEQNAHPGQANRLFAKRAKLVATAFDQATRELHGKKFGNPIRILPSKEEARTALGIPPEAKVLLVTGGSGGAKRINEAVLRIHPRLLREGWTVFHVAGERDLPRLTKPEDPRYHLMGFSDRMLELVAAADFMVSRAGASTLAELTAAGTPALLVPYPYAGAHQKANADELVAAGAAGFLADEELDSLENRLFPLLENREEMAPKCRALGRPNATRELAEALLALADGDRSHNRFQQEGA
ncbi:MAG: undecaprenyldiphospho-muramoylpentapeptide beta-N-acetylglucosaminyltransferase [Bacteroidota bacterium]